MDAIPLCVKSKDVDEFINGGSRQVYADANEAVKTRINRRFPGKEAGDFIMRRRVPECQILSRAAEKTE